MFSLKLLDHYWMNKSREPDGDAHDVTSHGKLRLLVNNIDISGCEDPHTDYGVNQAAVALLRSVFEDRTSQPEEPLIPHGCSIWLSCPNCVITYSVAHKGRDVYLDDFYVSGGSRGVDPHRYSSQKVRLPFEEYAHEVSVFARDALALLPNKKYSPDPDENIAYGILFAQHNALLSLLERAVPVGHLSPETRKTYNEIMGWWPTAFPH